MYLFLPNPSTISLANRSISSCGANNHAGSKFPCNVIFGPANFLASYGVNAQSTPMAFEPKLTRSLIAYHAPFANTIVGAPLILSTICLM